MKGSEAEVGRDLAEGLSTGRRCSLNLSLRRRLFVTLGASESCR